MTTTTFKMSTSGKQFLIKDATLFWAAVHTSKQKYKAEVGVKEYSVDVLIPEDIVDQLEDYSINKKPSSIKDKNKKSLKKKGEVAYPVEYEELYSLKLTSLDTWPDGKPKTIKVVMDGKPLTDNVGHGSVGDVIGRVGKANADGLHTVYLEAVNVKALVAYEGGDEFDFDSGEGSFDMEDDDIAF